MNRLRAFTIIIGGAILTVLGIGIWESPEISWEGFLAAWSIIGNEIARLKDDPFAVLGILVIIVGLVITYRGFKRLVRG